MPDGDTLRGMRAHLLLPPRKEDVLFREDLPDWLNNACPRGAERWGAYTYTEGYRRGGRLLVEHVIVHQRDQDYLVYPIFFLYRHHIELALKSLLGRAPILIKRPLTEEENKHLNSEHCLEVLWKDLKPIFSTICTASGWGPPNEADIEGVDSYIHQLTELDRRSFSGRYPCSQKGVPAPLLKFKRINLRHFAELMEQLANYFDGLGWLDPINLEDITAATEAE